MVVITCGFDVERFLVFVVVSDISANRLFVFMLVGLALAIFWPGYRVSIRIVRFFASTVLSSIVAFI